MSLYDDAKAIWRFNGDAADAKGNHDLVNTGAIYDGTIKRYGSHSVVMDGLNDFLSAANHSDFNQNEFSIIVPVYIAAKGVWNTLISKHNVAADTGWVAGITPGNFLFLQAGDGAGGWPKYSSLYDISAVSLGWHLYGVSHSLASHKLYWDDKLVVSNGGGTIAGSTLPVWFGRNTDDASYSAGQEDETLFFDRQITDGGVSVGQVAGGEYAELYSNFLAGIELVAGEGFIPFFFDGGYY